MSALAAYEAGLSGEPCWLIERDGSRRLLPVRQWCADAHPADATMLAAAVDSGGPVLDIGCGPGRLVAELLRQGVPALGIDVSRTAVRLARARGATVELRDVFGPVPREEHWRCALLADGNIGIGGDPRALLRRCAELLDRTGIVVADLSLTTQGIRRSIVHLQACSDDGASVGGPLPWAEVGVDCAEQLGAQAGLRVRSVQALHDHAVVVWEKEQERG